MPDEVCDLIKDLISDSKLSITAALGSPPIFERWRGECSDLDFDNLTALAFTLHEPICGASGIYEFAEQNPDALILEIGKLTPFGLSESWLSAKSDNKTAMTRWRAAAKQIKASTLGGAIAVNPNSGATSQMKWHRFTSKAQKAFENGVVMRPAAGNSIVKLMASPQPQIREP